MARAFVGLGANLGDPAAQVRAALQSIARMPSTRLVTQSPLYRSAPIGLPGQPDYCNAVCEIESDLSPPDLMAALIAIERAAGRERDGRKWGPRVLDLDLLHVDGISCATPDLVLPHPEIGRRNFVLVPWAQIAPEVRVDGVGRIGDAARLIGTGGLGAWK